MSRREAFRKPSPKGWMPKPGEKVYLPPTDSIGMMRESATVLRLSPGRRVIVEFKWGVTMSRRRFHVTDLRPFDDGMGGVLVEKVR